MRLASVAMAVVAAFALTTAGWTTASAQSKVPIKVTNLQYTPNQYGTEEEGEDNATNQPGIMLTFVNTTKQPVHSVVFQITDASGHDLGTVSRHGTFSPGVSITRYFGNLRLKNKDGVPVKATPIEVGFTNGKTWPK
jgi:hypothetical protein